MSGFCTSAGMTQRLFRIGNQVQNLPGEFSDAVLLCGRGKEYINLHLGAAQIVFACFKWPESAARVQWLITWLIKRLPLDP